jgi:hypothetical protein
MAHGGKTQLAEGFEDVGAKPLGIGVTAGRLENAPIDSPPNVLQQTA